MSLRQFLYGTCLVGYTEVDIPKREATTRVFANPEQIVGMPGYFKARQVMERVFTWSKTEHHTLDGALKHAWNFLNKLDISSPDGKYWKDRYATYASGNQFDVIIPDVRNTNVMFSNTLLESFKVKGATLLEPRALITSLHKHLKGFDDFDKFLIDKAILDTLDELCR